MSRNLKQPPDSVEVLQFRIAATALAQDLGRELGQVTDRLANEMPLHQIYDAVYLPTAVALADGLEGFGIHDLELLREPLRANLELARVQLRLLLKVLDDVVMLLSEKSSRR